MRLTSQFRIVWFVICTSVLENASSNLFEGQIFRHACSLHFARWQFRWVLWNAAEIALIVGRRYVESMNQKVRSSKTRTLLSPDVFESPVESQYQSPCAFVRCSHCLKLQVKVINLNCNQSRDLEHLDHTSYQPWQSVPPLIKRVHLHPLNHEGGAQKRWMQ